MRQTDQYDNHVTRRKLAVIEARLNSGEIFASADDYYWYKDRARELSAALVGKTPRQYDPVGFHHGMQSN